VDLSQRVACAREDLGDRPDRYLTAHEIGGHAGDLTVGEALGDRQFDHERAQPRAERAVADPVGQSGPALGTAAVTAHTVHEVFEHLHRDLGQLEDLVAPDRRGVFTLAQRLFTVPAAIEPSFCPHAASLTRSGAISCR
jgi:hypothetical protein